MNRKTLCLFVAAFLCVGRLSATLLDPTFNTGSGANGLIESVVEQPDGKLLICGNFTTFNGVTNSYIARLNSDGSVDTTFSSQVTYWVRTMSLQPDGKIVIGGFFNYVGSTPRGLIARLNSNGSLDTAFATGSGASGLLGEAVDGNYDSFIFATALQADGKVLITGNFTNYDGVNINGIARLNTDGTLDTNFNVGAGINYDSWGRSLQVQSNGQILLTGWFQNYDNQLYNRMVRINPDGSPDPTFNPFFGSLTAVYGAVELPSQQYVVVGDSQNTNGLFLENMRRLNADGTTDTNFLGADNDKTESVRLQADGKLLVGGYFSEVDGVGETNIARLNADGSVDKTFSADVNNFVWSITVQPDGKILAVGGFSSVDGVTANGIARFLPAAASGGAGPTIKILSPAAGVTSVSTPTVTINGTAQSVNGLDSVVVLAQPGSVTSSSGATNWSATLALALGTNVVTITATDDSYNSTVTNLVFVYATNQTPTSVLSLTYTGNGTVYPNDNGKVLTAGKTYVIDARPAPGYVFNGWTGGLTSSSASLRFVMEDGLALQANFIPNPFKSPAGAYQGLFYNSAAPTNAGAGYLVLTLGAGGGFSARLTLDGLAYVWTGLFSNSLSMTKTISPKNRNPIDLSFQFESNALQGTLISGPLTSSLVAYRATKPGATTRYTVLLSGNTNSIFAGEGYMAVTVTLSGQAQISGRLADGTAFSRVVPYGPDGSAPFYFPYRGTNAAAFGLLYLTATNSSAAGFVHWEKSAVIGTPFGSDLQAIGSVYVRPAAGTPLIQWTNAAIVLTNGDLATPLSQSFSLNPHNGFVVAAPNPDHVAVLLNPVNGFFSGTFVDPTTHRLTAMHGAFLEDEGYGGGYFLSGGQSGTVNIGESTQSENPLTR